MKVFIFTNIVRTQPCLVVLFNSLCILQQQPFRQSQKLNKFPYFKRAMISPFRLLKVCPDICTLSRGLGFLLYAYRICFCQAHEAVRYTNLAFIIAHCHQPFSLPVLLSCPRLHVYKVEPCCVHVKHVHAFSFQNLNFTPSRNQLAVVLF